VILVPWLIPFQVIDIYWYNQKKGFYGDLYIGPLTKYLYETHVPSMQCSTQSHCLPQVRSSVLSLSMQCMYPQKQNTQTTGAALAEWGLQEKTHM